MSYVKLPRYAADLPFGDAAGAAAGTAIAPGIGTVVGSAVNLKGLLSAPSPRYEGGPLLSTVVNRLQALVRGDPSAIAQTKQDAQTGGAGWRDVALVLAPSVRADLFGPPTRALNDLEQQLVNVAVNPPTTFHTPTPTGAGPGLASMFAGVNASTLETLAVVGFGALLLSTLAGGRRRRGR